MLKELNNALSTYLITLLRDQKSDALRFRQGIKELTRQLLYEALSEAPQHPKAVSTWQGDHIFEVMQPKEYVIVSILRAALPMMESAMELLVEAKGGFLAMKRDERTHEAKLYYDRVPDAKDKHLLVLDPMLATGGSMIDAVTLLKSKAPKSITVLHIIGSPEGIKALQAVHPDINIVIAQIDEKLNAEKFILPGLGDAGDRAYNTL